jgi:hypothetical protein
MAADIHDLSPPLCSSMHLWTFFGTVRIPQMQRMNAIWQLDKGKH